MNMQKLADLERKFREVHTLACGVTKTHGAWTAKSGKEGAVEAQQSYEEAMAKLREQVSAYTVDTVKEAALYFQVCVFEKAMVREGTKTTWNSKDSHFLAKALISLKNAFVVKTEAEAQNDDRVRLLNSRIRTTNAFIPVCEEGHYTPEYGLNPRAVQDAHKKLTDEIGHCNKNDSLMVRMRGQKLQELLRNLETNVPHDWFVKSDRPQATRQSQTATLKDALPEGSHEALSAVVNPPPAKAQKGTRPGARSSRRKTEGRP